MHNVGRPCLLLQREGAERGNGGEAGQALHWIILNPHLQRSPNLTARGLLWKTYQWGRLSEEGGTAEIRNKTEGLFPGGPGVAMPHFQAGGHVFNPLAREPNKNSTFLTAQPKDKNI